MNNVSTLKKTPKVESPKTPGGISKSLLTPCRRIGLSRKWRKNVVSPFVSPLAGNSATEENYTKSDSPSTKKESRKRRVRNDDDILSCESTSMSLSNELPQEDEVLAITAGANDNIETTPSRFLSNPQRKKSKISISTLVLNKENDNIDPSFNIDSNKQSLKIVKDSNEIKETPSCNMAVTPVRTKSKSKVNKLKDLKNKASSETNSNAEEAKFTQVNNSCEQGKQNTLQGDNKLRANSKNIDDTYDHKENNIINKEKPRSPDNLTKECIIVIQKKIFKKDLEKIEETKRSEHKPPESQVLFDSDSDDVPLSTLNTKELKPKEVSINTDIDDDFADSKKIIVKKLDKTTSIGGLPTESNVKKKKLKKQTLKVKTTEPIQIELKPSSQSSLDDEDDFVIDSRRTILIRKSYEKVPKPEKAKSTGSITQKDIDNLKARIEMKKKLLLAKAVTQDTEELRDLIKKWQRGCQDALVELMELMKNKFPDKQNMDYAEILDSLKIPATLVGYDEENDCFNTPTDENIILSKFN